MVNIMLLIKWIGQNICHINLLNKNYVKLNLSCYFKIIRWRDFLKSVMWQKVSCKVSETENETQSLKMPLLMQVSCILNGLFFQMIVSIAGVQWFIVFFRLVNVYEPLYIHIFLRFTDLGILVFFIFLFYCYRCELWYGCCDL